MSEQTKIKIENEINLDDIYKKLDEMKVERTSIFCSISHEDKDQAIRLVHAMNKIGLRCWCMYKQDGRDTNIIGENYNGKIDKELDKSCVFLFFVSEHSIRSAIDGGVAPEIERVYNARKRSLNGSKIEIIPVFLDGTTYNQVPKEIREKTQLSGATIYRGYNKDTTDEELRKIAVEIENRVMIRLIENFNVEKKDLESAQHLSRLMMHCIAPRWTASTISDDIKKSKETDLNYLKEMHILTDVVKEYDCNTYSCMIIASNLLGVKMNNSYAPLSKGIKYYYYGLEEDINGSFEYLKRKLLSFIAKDATARKSVVRMIRNEFARRNKMFLYFEKLDVVYRSEFPKFFGIVEDGKTKVYSEEEQDMISRDKKVLDDALSTADAEYFFAYTSGKNEIFCVPEEFYKWLKGDESITEIEKTNVYRFIDVLNHLNENLGETSVAFSDARKELSLYCLYLNRMRIMEKWQEGTLTTKEAFPDTYERGDYIGKQDGKEIYKAELKASDAHKLVNFLLDYSMETPTRFSKKFPRLANWLRFDYDENGNRVPISEQIISEAMQNLIFVEIKKGNYLDLCYSFLLFVGESKVDGAWYSTGTNLTESNTEDVVITYESNDDDIDDFKKAFRIIFDINPDAKEILKQKNSILLNFI